MDLEHRQSVQAIYPFGKEEKNFSQNKQSIYNYINFAKLTEN